ncbi:hypothetical protein ABT095_32355 [Kitasatospora sp. NPDC002227]|uniref:hypothetical protein n=1 Tax=Kitasatospora sp. NPDC002227 TaxID=3154773 RepID=UPI00332D8410
MIELAYAAGKLARRRVFLLCLAMLVLGSPWVQKVLQSPDSRTPATAWYRRVLATPGWEPSLAFDHYTRPVLYDWSAGLSVLVLLLGCYLLLPRLVPAAPAGPVRWMTAIGTCTAVSAVSALPEWALNSGLQDLGTPVAALLATSLEYSIAFGLLLGLAAAATLAPTAGAALPRLLRRRPGRTTTMAAPATPALGSAPGDVTRYLCAAAYLDPAFARIVVQDVLSDEFGAIAPSPGVDLVPVARHCLTARELQRRLHRRILPVWFALLLISPLWLLIGRLALTVLGYGAKQPAPRHPVRGRAEPDAEAALWRVAAAALAALVLTVGIDLLLGLLPVGGVFSWLLGSYLFGIPPVLALIGAGAYAYRLMAEHLGDTDQRLRALRRETFDPEAVPQPAPQAAWIKDRLAAVAETQAGNVSVYSGFTPFLGYAATYGTARIAAPLLPAEPFGRPAAEITEFDTWELLTEVRNRLAALAEAPPAADEVALTGLLLEDRVFVDGATLHGDRRFLGDRQLTPLTRLTPEQLREVAERPSGAVRHYLAAHLPLWGDDVVPSLLLHMSQTGRTLHIHVELHILGPVHRLYHSVDTLPPRATGETRRAAQLAALRSAWPLLGGALSMVRAYRTAERLRVKRLVRDHTAFGADPGFDYGARVSLREAGMAPEYQNYFQLLDAERVLSALWRHALTAVREFLDEHGVDTTEFRRQQQTILNQGIVQQGGVSYVGNQAVGAGAQAHSHGFDPTSDGSRS